MIRSFKNFFHLLEAYAANVWYGFPSKQMRVVGVTGTDGKTTTASLIYHILHESGKKVALISTVGAYIGGKQFDVGFHVTTPSSWSLQSYIKKALESGAEYLVLETTSHALDQNRIAGIHIDYAVLTNITHEHLDYHKTFNNYRDTKLKLFKMAKVAVLNRDDASCEYFEKNLFAQEIVSYSLKNSIAHFTPEKFQFKTKLLGEFNIANSLAAAAVTSKIGISDADIKKALASFEPPIGRQEIIYDKSYTIMIDFAHTPHAFAEILPAVAKKTSGRLIHVFGSAGLRDQTKRPLMGEEAGRFDDMIVLTAEDPRTESVETIMDEIAAGIQLSERGFIFGDYHHAESLLKSKKYIFKIPDRKTAIEFAIRLAQTEDTVLLTGKGHEASMNYGQGEEAWNEKKIALDAVEKRADL